MIEIRVDSNSLAERIRALESELCEAKKKVPRWGKMMLKRNRGLDRWMDSELAYARKLLEEWNHGSAESAAPADWVLRAAWFIVIEREFLYGRSHGRNHKMLLKMKAFMMLASNHWEVDCEGNKLETEFAKLMEIVQQPYSRTGVCPTRRVRSILAELDMEADLDMLLKGVGIDFSANAGRIPEVVRDFGLCKQDCQECGKLPADRRKQRQGGT